MMDVKKLVTGFLVLAVATSASALLISTFGGSLTSANTSANNPSGVAIVAGATNAAQTDPTLAGNAFLPQAPAQALATDDTALASTTDAIMGDPGNLTNILTNAYMNNLVAANPTGPAQDASGNPSLTQPDNESVISQFMSSSTAIASVATPNWDVEADRVPIIVAATSSQDAVTSYSNAIQNIFNQNFVQPNLQGMLNNNSDPSAVGYIQPKIQTALQDIAGLQTPASLTAFQKSLVKLLVYEKNVLSLANEVTSSSDPLKTALVLENEAPKYNAAIQSFQTEFQKTSAVAGFKPFAINQMPNIPKPSGVIGFVENALGIKTAYALFGLGDITFDPSVFGEMLINYANDIALQILKNLIMSLMQKTVLKWVQGNGVPRFIQSWGTTLVNAYTQTAINALNSQMVCINSAPFAAQVRLTLGATYKPNTNICAVQFQSQLGNNLNSFYNHFNNGGWITYGATLQPDNNYYGSVFFTAQAVANTAYNAQQASQAKSISNQGWNGGQTCDDGSNPSTGTHFVCPDGSKASVAGLCFIVGQQPFPAAVSPNGGICADGSEPEVTQPGQVTGQVFNSAVDSGGKLTAAANGIAGLLDAFLSSLLNSLATDAITAGSGVLNNLGSGGGGGGGGGQSGQIPISCTGTQQSQNQETVTFIGAGGQTISVTNGQSNTSVPTYTWSVPGGSPASGPGGQFTTTFSSGGTYVATITDTNPTDGGVSAQCNVTVQ